MSYDMTVSENMKSATITISSTYNLDFPVDVAEEQSKNICGSVSYKQQFTFDLTGDKPIITNYATSQHLEP